MTEESSHPFERWFGLPVCVQFREAYALPRDKGPKKIELASDGPEKVIKEYGTPVVDGDKNVAAIALSGNLQPDGERVALLVESETLGIVRIGLDPKSIAFITAIPVRAKSPTILQP